MKPKKIKIIEFLTLVPMLALILSVATPCLADAADDGCLKCHGPDKAAKRKAPVVMPGALDGSIHESLLCGDCHAFNGNKPHKGKRDVDCGECHSDAAAGYASSPHQASRSAGVEAAPSCADCHGGHNILAIDNPASKVSADSAVFVCVGCHEDEDLAERSLATPSPQMIKAYRYSVHGQAVIGEHSDSAPRCTDCHGSHSTMPADDPAGPVYKLHVSTTCGSCHMEIGQHYAESVHGTALAAGITDSPTCTDCHGEHNILSPQDPESKVFAGNVARTCSECHASEELVGKFGLKGDRAATFAESFHGVAIELGSRQAANCASCHGVHDIYPQADPRSTIHPANIQRTCGECHDDLPAEFARGTVHVSSTQEDSGALYVRTFYYWFIPIIIALFIAYRVLEYKRRVKRVD
jgi:hypothetical protein